LAIFKGPKFHVFSKMSLEANICGYKYSWMAVSTLLLTWIYSTSFQCMAYSGIRSNRQRLWLLHWLGSSS
uniref:Uncharacterized protein n=1 Tax=Amphimedon queenslandica TaxID=400682 RepID=A0A1X7V2J6_AMPQE